MAPSKLVTLAATIILTIASAPPAMAQEAAAAIASRSVDYTEKVSRDNATIVMVDFLTGFLPAIQTIDARTFHANIEAFAKTSEIFKLPTILLGDEGVLPRSVHD